jgi:glycosyltransferase involved in cell wall biosynthesis
MQNTPFISVLMPVYNCENYVFEAVESILQQTYIHFELLIIDDCSTDDTLRICKSFEDERIVIIEKEKNTGYTNSLNYGLKISKGKYIARMDGDDISLPTRFEKQVAFLQKSKDSEACGSSIQIINSIKILKHPSSYDDIKVKLCFSNSFYHPTMMFRREVLLENNYDKNFEPAEDYDLWTKLIFKIKMVNIDEVLLKYRVHENQISNYKQDIQLKIATISQMRMFQILFNKKIIDSELFEITIKKKPTKSNSDLKLGLVFFKEIKLNNRKLQVYKIEKFESKLDNLRISFIKSFIKNNNLSFKNLLIYLINCDFKDLWTLTGFKKRFKF